MSSPKQVSNFTDKSQNNNFSHDSSQMPEIMATVSPAITRTYESTYSINKEASLDYYVVTGHFRIKTLAL